MDWKIFTPELKLDLVLQQVVNASHQSPKSYTDLAIDMKIEGYFKEVMEILLKLLKDGYITSSQDNGYGMYVSTFDGRLFIDKGGYSAKALSEANELAWKQSEIDRQRTLDTLLGQNSTDLNVLTSRMVNATLFAGVAAFLLLLWQVWLWFYPLHKDFIHRNEPEIKVSKTK